MQEKILQEDAGKVTIVMPCYNSERTIAQAIGGVINQSYRPIEFILVNDGATDQSDQIIRSYTAKIQEAGIEFKYIVQENKGLGGAILTGLKHVTGEYLAWVDSDDELLPESVSVRVNFLRSHPDYGSVSSNAVTFVSGDKEDRLLSPITDQIEINSCQQQFLPMIIGLSLFCPGCHLVRTEVFRESHGGMEIYPARHGQNLQMLLPVYYVSKHGFIDQPLYKYRVEGNNMTAQICAMEFPKYCEREKEYITIVRNTLPQIPGLSLKDQKKYLHVFAKHRHERILDRAFGEPAGIQRIYWKTVVKLDHLFYKDPPEAASLFNIHAKCRNHRKGNIAAFPREAEI